MTETFDVIVVGAGSSGLMAANQASQQGARVLVLEKNKIPGRKLLLSGGGRCNVTNRTNREDLIKHIPGNGKFLYSALNQFDQEDIISYFENRGVQLKEEDHGRMFPVTDKARTILDTLLKDLEDNQVQIRYKSAVAKVLYDRENSRVLGVETQDGQTFHCHSLVLAVGGRAYPKTGATGDGYAWAKSAGHTISRLYPTEAPLLSQDPEILDKSLQGVSLRDIKVSLWEDQTGKKEIVSHQMDMIITHFGYSGPAILRTSGHVNLWLYDHPEAETAYMTIDLQPDLSQIDLENQAEANRDKLLINVLKDWMPERMGQALIKRLKLDPAKAYKQLDHKDQEALIQLVKTYPITSTGSQPIEKGFVTGGGVSTKEVNPKTMESKLMSGLFFCGELLDINGYTGGYNITAAFVTGTIAGQYAAWQSFT